MKITIVVITKDINSQTIPFIKLLLYVEPILSLFIKNYQFKRYTSAGSEIINLWGIKLSQVEVILTRENII